MTAIKLLAAGLIAAIMLSAPAMACNNGLAKRHLAKKANASVSATAHYINSYARVPSSRVAPIAAPADGENCDAGDNSFVC
jgi:hypothetical protein